MKMELGEKIRKLRKGKMTQAELAERIGVHETSIRRWELGNRVPDIKDIQKIAEVFSIPVTDLLDISTPQPEATTDKNNDWYLVFRDRDRVVDLPDTPDNRLLYTQIVQAILTAPKATA